MAGGGIFWDLRLIMVGRDHHLREVAFDRLGQSPAVGGIELKWLGPVSIHAMASLTTEAQHHARRMGYPADAFGIVGLGTDRVIAVVPRDRPGNGRERQRLLELLGVEDSRR